jgi:putative ABC transport system permease protein
MFADPEVRTAAKVALLGSTVARELFGDGDPVGEVIRIRNIPFVVMGLLSTKGTSMRGDDQDDVVLVPYTSAMKRLTGSTTIRGMLIQTEKRRGHGESSAGDYQTCCVNAIASRKVPRMILPFGPRRRSRSLRPRPRGS